MRYLLPGRRGFFQTTGLCGEVPCYECHFTAIGALNKATLGWFDLQRKMYKKIPINGHHEVIAMSGEIGLYQGNPVVQTHMVVGSVLIWKQISR
jgi:predicted DNA-binding protein with PD1-like motif